MNTTNLFVELMIIGIGAVSAIGLAVIGCLQPGTIPLATLGMETAATILTLAPLLALTYVVGILIDRIADVIFKHFWANRLRGRYFGSEDGSEDDGTDAYHLARRMVLVGPDRLARLIEYGRSRMRICRGWTINGMLLFVAWNVFASQRLAGVANGDNWWLAGNASFLLLTVGCCWAWRVLMCGLYDKVQRQHTFLIQTQKGFGAAVMMAVDDRAESEESLS